MKEAVDISGKKQQGVVVDNMYLIMLVYNLPERNGDEVHRKQHLGLPVDYTCTAMAQLGP